MPLQTTYRALNFGELIGNKDVIDAVKANLKDPDHNHSMLFTGGAGTGKTTLARIVAMRLGAYDPDSLNNPGFREINVGDDTGIDAVRRIAMESSRVPLGSPVRVFFLDECHRMTTPAQEMWLKLLEEAEGCNYYLFATTNPEALKDTFRRRVATYEMKPISDDIIANYLADICKQEEIDAPQDVLDIIASDSLGSVGVALGILDAIKGLSAPQMAKEAHKQAAKQNAVIELCRALADKKSTWATIRPILAGLKDQSEDAEGIRRAVLAYCSNWLLKQENAKAFVILDCFREPTYNIGFPGIVYACYMALKG